MNENKNNEVILIGLPNSGKSTLINTLSKNKTSIVGSKPNTTRDKVSQRINSVSYTHLTLPTIYSV